ncbi:MAG: CCA tRNA nucleotidyltransferase [Elusimicrobia bacterium]|nr:CCA tRNA nucleotidyltransferase [Elusimicrobiota bacterium]
MLPGYFKAGLPILKRLQESGFEAWFAGGAVRDLLLGRPVRDIDIATGASAEDVLRLFKKVKTVPGGLKHGTVIIVVHGGKRYDLMTFGRAAPGKSILGRLKRFDYSINGMAMAADGTIIDNYGGRKDIENRTLRTLRSPDETFRADPLRILRGLRFASAMGLSISPEILKAMRRNGKGLKSVSAERLRDELLKLLESADKPSGAFRLMRELGLLKYFLPEFGKCFGFAQNKYHAYDVAEHTLMAVDRLPKDKPLLRWTALLHDIGKPVSCRNYGSARASFIGHEIIGAKMAEKLMERLRFSTGDIRYTGKMIRHHMWQYRPEVRDSTIRRFLAKLGMELFDDFLLFKGADRYAKGKGEMGPGRDIAFRERVRDMMRRSGVLKVKDLALGGKDIMRVAGAAEGPAVGKILKRLLARVLKDPSLNTRKKLLAELKGRPGGENKRGEISPPARPARTEK